MTAVADARGVCFEYAPRRIIRERNTWDHAYFPHHKFGTGAGRYSDDAQMSLAVAECLLDHGPAATTEQFAAKFVEVFKREAEPREGYAGGFYQFLQEIQDSAEFLARIRPESDKSGGAMRAGPCGLFQDVRTVLDVSARQARITHDTPDGVAAAQAAALMAHYMLYDLGARKNLPDFLNEILPGHDWSRPHKGEVGPKGLESVRAALTSFLRTETFADLLIDCVNWGGDVDTAAAIAAPAAACARNYDRTIPPALLEDLENGPFGRDYLRAVDLRLDKMAQGLGISP
ncbi:MAG: ADP-ribosylglycohydrolase family protein [Caulobacteraceae bacterium]